MKSQPKFRLGRDRAKAELAYHRLGARWDSVVEQHRCRGLYGNYLPPSVDRDDRPVWAEEVLIIAEAIRKRISNQWATLRARIERVTGQAPAWWLTAMWDKGPGIARIPDILDQSPNAIVHGL